MITAEGITHIKRYLGGFVPNIATAIAFGVGTRGTSLTDTSLQFEVGRVPIALTSFDFVNSKVVYKAELPTSFSGSIHEVALFTRYENPQAGLFGSRLLTSFDSATETWTDGVFTAGSTRIGVDSLAHTPAASGTTTSALGDIVIDLSGNSGADKFVFALNAGANVGNVSASFLTDNANYYTFNLGALGSGYQIIERNKSTATVTGNPNWGNIIEIRVSTTATSAGAALVEFDGIRIEDVDTISPDYVMVSRQVLATPYVKQDGTAQEIEVALDVNIA